MASTQAIQTDIRQWAVAPDDATERFIENLRIDKSPETVRAYAIGIKTFTAWFEAQSGRTFEPIAITPLDVKLYLGWLYNTKKLSPATVNNYLAGLRAFLWWTTDEGITPTNAAERIKGIKKEKSGAVKWLGRQEQYQLLRTCDELVQLGELRASGDADAAGNVWPKRDKALVRLMLASGLRRAEVCALDVEDVTIRERSGAVAVRNGKGGKAREVPLNSDARKALRQWMDVHPLRGAEGRFAAATPLFVSQKGNQRLDKRSLAERIKIIAARARLDGVHPHTLRHTCAKNMLDAKHSMRVVADVLGHESLNTTMIYTTPSMADKTMAVESTNWED